MHPSRNATRPFLRVLLTLTAACGGSDLVLPGPSSPNDAGTPAAISIFAGDHQTAAPGAPLPAQIVVKVVDSQGNPVAGRSVAFTPMSSGAQVTPQTVSTDANGLAGAVWVLGTASATQEVVVQVVGGDQLQVRFSATAQPGGGNQPPTAVSDEYTTLEGGDHVLAVGSADGVLQNDRDPEGGSLTASDASDPPNGKVSLNRDGSFNYTPASGFFGDDHFTYQANDPSGSSSTATVTIHVLPVNDSPRFSIKVHDVKVGRGQTPHTISRFAVNVSPGADNESDQVLTFEVIANSNPGLFASGPTITRDGQGDTATLTFTPAGDQKDSADITVVLRDNGGTANGGADTSRSQTFRISIK
jgi:hypothetical protein